MKKKESLMGIGTHDLKYLAKLEMSLLIIMF
jgi:hypothetical protein